MSDPEAPFNLADHYSPDTPVVVEGEPMTLQEAFDWIDLCPVPHARLSDPTARNGYIAKMLFGGGSLRDEHVDFLPKPKESPAE